jgi:hypothetical protein
MNENQIKSSDHHKPKKAPTYPQHNAIPCCIPCCLSVRPRAAAVTELIKFSCAFFDVRLRNQGVAVPLLLLAAPAASKYPTLRSRCLLRGEHGGGGQRDPKEK